MTSSKLTELDNRSRGNNFDENEFTYEGHSNHLKHMGLTARGSVISSPSQTDVSSIADLSVEPGSRLLLSPPMASRRSGSIASDISSRISSANRSISFMNTSFYAGEHEGE